MKTCGEARTPPYCPPDPPHPTPFCFPPRDFAAPTPLFSTGEKQRCISSMICSMLRFRESHSGFLFLFLRDMVHNDSRVSTGEKAACIRRQL